MQKTNQQLFIEIFIGDTKNKKLIMCEKLKNQLKDKLENLNIELFGHLLIIESVRMISASLDNLLIKLIQNNCLTEDQENELRLLINELNRAVFLENFSFVSFNQERIKNII